MTPPIIQGLFDIPTGVLLLIVGWRYFNINRKKDSMFHHFWGLGIMSIATTWLMAGVLYFVAVPDTLIINLQIIKIISRFVVFLSFCLLLVPVLHLKFKKIPWQFAMLPLLPGLIVGLVLAIDLQPPVITDVGLLVWPSPPLDHLITMNTILIVGIILAYFLISSGRRQFRVGHKARVILLGVGTIILTIGTALEGINQTLIGDWIVNTAALLGAFFLLLGSLLKNVITK